MDKKKSEPSEMTFELVKGMGAADLAAVAELFVNASEAVSKGDVGQIEVVAGKASLWAQMLLIRHEARMDELRATAAVVKASHGSQGERK